MAEGMLKRPRRLIPKSTARNNPGRDTRRSNAPPRRRRDHISDEMRAMVEELLARAGPQATAEDAARLS